MYVHNISTTPLQTACTEDLDFAKDVTADVTQVRWGANRNGGFPFAHVQLVDNPHPPVDAHMLVPTVPTQAMSRGGDVRMWCVRDPPPLIRPYVRDP